MILDKNSLTNLPECDLIDNKILRRLREGLSTHVLVTGLPGRGKSSFAVRTAERLDARIKNGVQFSHKDIVDSFLKLLERVTRIKTPGEIIVIEEVSVLFPARRSMSGDNVAVGMIFDTIRKKRAILISNAPLFKTIDPHMRALADILVECQRVLKTYGLVKLKAWVIKTDVQTAKTYRYRFKRGLRDIMFHYSKAPNKEIWSAYEKDKDKFIFETYLKLQKKAELKEKKENKDIRSLESDKEKRNRGIFYKHTVEKKHYKLIAEEEGLTTGTIANIITNMRKKQEFS